jgi:hypothetical protein
MAADKPNKIKLNHVRLSFPDIFEAVQYEGKGAFRFNATFLIEPGSENDKLILAAIDRAATEKFGKKKAAVLKSIENNANKYCYLDGDLKEYQGYEGMKYLSTHRKQEQGRPGVYNRDKSPVTAEDGIVYAGCYVNASVEIYAQDGTYAGVRAGLVAVQFSADGDSFSGGSQSNPDDFDDLGAPEETDESALV